MRIGDQPGVSKLNRVKRIGAREARNNLADLIGQVYYGGEPVIVERSGKPMVAVVPLAILEKYLAAQSPANASSDAPPATEAFASQPAPRRSLFGVFPELALLEFGDEFQQIKQLWQESLEKQMNLLQGQG
jgi:prevent-host-death family protein